MNKNRYLIIAFGWSWIFWGTAYLLSYINNFSLNFNLTLFDLFTLKESGIVLLTQILFAVAVYGPFIAFLVERKSLKQVVFKKFNIVYLLIVIGIPVIMGTAVLLANLLFHSNFNFRLEYIFISFIYFISNFLTSGSEEYGWRSILLPIEKKKCSNLWDLSVSTGVIWALWHIPLLLILYASLGFVTLVSSIAGFFAIIIAMAYVSNWLYLKTESILLLQIFHALNNTSTYILTLCIVNNPFTFVSALVVWGIVILIDKFEKKEVLNW